MKCVDHTVNNYYFTYFKTEIPAIFITCRLFTTEKKHQNEKYIHCILYTYKILISWYGNVTHILTLIFSSAVIHFKDTLNVI